MNRADIGSSSIAYRVFGKGRIDLVIEGCLGGACAEWWEIAEELAADHTVLVYDRAGYGESTPSSLERSPENVVAELQALLRTLEAEKRLAIIGHSQGGLYAELFALRNPARVKGLLLLDPLSFEDWRFKERLSPSEFKKSGVDKTAAFRLGRAIASVGLGFLFAGAIKKAPPFYYRTFSREAEDYIVKSMMRRAHHQTALEEHRLAHDPSKLRGFAAAWARLEAPITLIAHSPAKMIGEIELFGNVDRELATRIDAIWQGIMETTLGPTSKPRKVVAENSGHYIHLTDLGLVKTELALLLGSE